MPVSPVNYHVLLPSTSRMKKPVHWSIGEMRSTWKQGWLCDQRIVMCKLIRKE